MKILNEKSLRNVNGGGLWGSVWTVMTKGSLRVGAEFTKGLRIVRRW
jgi:bacteriocin-like protein